MFILNIERLFVPVGKEPSAAGIIGLPAGIISFLLAKRQVDKNRLKQLKVRQRMRKSNEGDYEGSRYHHPAEDVKLDH
uniref:Uncharacterized protein n=1 Tax=Dicentrarchus labrax TaxID=13489 RepID=A0A8P4K684_DICLA